MATITGIRGMLLEEALLFLLRTSGYRTVDDANAEPDLMKDGAAGIELFGRGCNHQIDAIADFVISSPFSNPQRLLVEAKCFSPQYKVGVSVARNAVGVLKDVSEAWVVRHGVPPKRRYHYQYAIFSASGYTKEIEKYAFAQDIYLITLKQVAFFQPIIDAIRRIKANSFGAISPNKIEVNLKRLRQAVRTKLRNLNVDIAGMVPEVGEDGLADYFDPFESIRFAVLGTIGQRLPVFLVPNPLINIDDLRVRERVRISWDRKGWYIIDENNRQLFSFDLPPDLFELYARSGAFTREGALNLKAEYMNRIQYIISRGDDVFFGTLVLDMNWLSGVRERLRAQNPDRFEEDYLE